MIDLPSPAHIRASSTETIVSVDEIKRASAHYFGLDPDALGTQDRSKQLSACRHIAIYLARQSTELSLKDIGRAFNRQHTAVAYSLDRTEALLHKRPDLQRATHAIAKELGLDALTEISSRSESVEVRLSTAPLFERFRRARTLDLSLTTGRGLLSSHLEHIEYAIRRHECHVRIVLIHPDSLPVTEDELRDALCPGADLQAIIAYTAHLLFQLHTSLMDDGCATALNVRFRRSAPTCNMIFVDNEFLRITPFLAHMNSDEVPIYDIERNADGIFQRYENAFNRLWIQAQDDPRFFEN
jgi:hypothetical protein